MQCLRCAIRLKCRLDSLVECHRSVWMCRVCRLLPGPGAGPWPPRDRKSGTGSQVTRSWWRRPASPRPLLTSAVRSGAGRWAGSRAPAESSPSLSGHCEAPGLEHWVKMNHKCWKIGLQFGFNNGNVKLFSQNF